MAPWPRYEQDEIDAVAEVLRSGKVNYWTGTQGREFEREFAEFTGVKHAVFVANGTVALELALRALDLPAGSEVITTPHTFIATASAIVAVGLRPVFADIDPDTGNITPETIEAAVTPRTSAVVVVHLGGWPARMPEIQDLCRSAGPSARGGLRAGARRDDRRPPRGHLLGCRGMVVLPGQDHHHRRRGRNGRDRRRGTVATDVVVQGPRQVLGGRLRARTSARVPLAARVVRQQLPGHGDAGCHRADPVPETAGVAQAAHRERDVPG